MDDLPRRESAKRDACYGARERWRLILRAIAWAERQPTARRNDPRRRLAEEARKNDAMARGRPHHD